DWPPRKTKYVEHLMADADLSTCLVSAADKLHNARAILHDLRASDDHAALWQRFSSSPKQSGWYYGRLERALGARLAHHDGREMVTELRHALDAIASIRGCGAFGEGLATGRDGGACPADDGRQVKLTS
ncbi:MAG: hypothetical protein OEX21_12035, partial [Betaproteobacteria bacterium]|nr:hypothetical protein [Betaproteobacteria bacterium]